METKEIIERYYSAFNAKEMDKFLDLLSDSVRHEINQGGQEIGKEAFSDFMEKMNGCYDEKVVDLTVFENGNHGAAEFFIEGKYISTDKGLPEARGQHYKIRCGAFFEVERGKITRVTNYYNLKEWLAMVR